MDQINVLDKQDKVTHFGTRCSLIFDQFSLRNEPYETPSHLFCTKSLSNVEYKLIVKVYGENKHGDYKLQVDFLGDYDEEDFKDLTFFYLICDKTGKICRGRKLESFKVSSQCSINLISEPNFKDCTFVHESPLVLVFYIINQSPVSGKHGILTDVKKISSLPSSHSNSTTECQLSTDLSNLYEKGDLSDFNIVTKNKTFNVHKCVLAARSTVFAKYFENNENNQDSITLVDVKSDLVEEILRFIYTNAVQKLDELVIDLYNIAKEYNLRELQDKCISYMMKNVSVDNAMSLLHLAKKHDEKTLLGKITEYFVDNTDQILDSKTTDEFLKPLFDFELSLSSSESLNK